MTRMSLYSSTSSRCCTGTASPALSAASPSSASAVMVMTQKLLSRLFARLTYLARLAPPRRSMRRQLLRVCPTCCRYSKLRISSTRTVARRWTEASARYAASNGLYSYSSPCQLFGACSTLSSPSTFIHCGWDSSNGEPKAAMTPFLTNPLTPAGLRMKRWPLTCIRRSSRVAASRRAASTTFFGARGLPATMTENEGSRSRWLRSHSTAAATAPSSESSGASAKRHAQDMTASEKASSSGAPRSLPSRVPAARVRASACEPPKAVTCASRSAARGLASVTDAGCTCPTLSGISTGGCGGNPPESTTRLRTIFFVRPGVSMSFASFTGFSSPRPSATKSRTKRMERCRPTPLQRTTSLPGRSRSTPPAPSLQVKPAAAPSGTSWLQSRCAMSALRSGRASAPSAGPSGPSRSLASCDAASASPASRAQGCAGDRSHRSRGTATARRRSGLTPVCQYRSRRGACSWHACSSSAQAPMISEKSPQPGCASRRSGSCRWAATMWSWERGRATGSPRADELRVGAAS
mmetsp:Transcript_14460/g.45456  ORF Transcript_14460/g.45456 Transcript_14460/m.45456 type:complete len:523 (+) Transcript_14460:324-1892(+)